MARRRLLGQSFDGEGPEFRILIADLARFLVLRRIKGSLHFFDTIPNLYCDARLGRIAFKRGYILPGGEKTATGTFECRLRFRRKLLRVGLDIRYFDFRNAVDRWLSLSMKRLNRGCANSDVNATAMRHALRASRNIAPERSQDRQRNGQRQEKSLPTASTLIVRRTRFRHILCANPVYLLPH